jgi:hypothetical protein
VRVNTSTILLAQIEDYPFEYPERACIRMDPRMIERLRMQGFRLLVKGRGIHKVGGVGVRTIDKEENGGNISCCSVWGTWHTF